MVLAESKHITSYETDIGDLLFYFQELVYYERCRLLVAYNRSVYIRTAEMALTTAV
jgi:hypothetical protein